MTRTDEMKNLTCWEIKIPSINMTMIQVFLNHLTIVMSIMVTLLNSIVLSLPHYVRLQVSQILQRFISHIFLINFVSNQNH